MLRVKTLLRNPFHGRHPRGKTLNHRKFSRGWDREGLPPHHRRSSYIHPFVRIVNVSTVHAVHSGHIDMFIIDMNGKTAW